MYMVKELSYPYFIRLGYNSCEKRVGVFFSLDTIHKLTREVSDHNPLILDTLEVSNGCNFSRLEKRLFQEFDFMPKVASGQNQPVKAKKLGESSRGGEEFEEIPKGWGQCERQKNAYKQLVDELQDFEELFMLNSEQLKRTIEL